MLKKMKNSRLIRKSSEYFSKLSMPAIMSCIVFGIIILHACDDIIEKDITDKDVFLIAPADSLKTKYSTQTFMWDWVEGALTYNLRVVTPSFDRIEQIIVDTTVSTNKFTLNLSPGVYEWGVRAMNGSSATDYFIRILEIDSTLDLRNQKVTLSYPVEGYATNNQKVSFVWAKLYNATSYYFELRPPDWNGSNPYYSRTTTGDTVNVSIVPEGNYTWAVKATNDNTSTDFTTRSVAIDRTAPAKPGLLEPADKALITENSVKLTWSRNEKGARLYDSVYVAIDTFFTNVKISQRVDTTFLSIDLNQDTTYFWKVKTVDAAKNLSNFDIRKFTKK
jgi:hypothetical protein